jgi:hypothetical protein
MSEKENQKQPLVDLSKAPREDLEATLKYLVESGLVSAEAVNGELDKIRAATGENAIAVSETGPLKPEKVLSPEQQKKLLGFLKSRFELKRGLHDNIQWYDVEKALKAHPDKMWSLQQLEATGGEPDVIGEENGELIFGDCSAESPSGRRNVVFDMQAEEYLKEHYPGEKYNGNAADMVAEYGVDFMDEAQYRELQNKLKLDQHSWSWIKTPADIRKSGFAINGDRIYGDVFVRKYDAYIHRVGRAFRASLRVPKT